MEKLLIPVYLVIIIVKKVLTSRILLVGAGILVVALIGMNAYNKAAVKDTPKLPVYQQNLPDKEIAPSIWQTPTSRYYIVTSHQEGILIVLDDYFAFEGNDWKRKKTPLPFPMSRGRVIGRE